MPEQKVDGYAYFMIRISRETVAASRLTLSGVVERLGTGEKQTFASGHELLRFMSGQEQPNQTLRTGGIARNNPVVE